MKSTKSIAVVLPPPPAHMVGDGFRVHNFFPSNPVIGEQGMSPFFLLDYNSKWEIPPSEKQRGVSVHPHRGFETVTIAYHGSVAHHDSTGKSGVIREGDVQWMTAGSGILHKEYHEKEFSKKGGIFQVVQLWVNLPSGDKMTPPKYQAIDRDRIPKAYLDSSDSYIQIVAGSFNDMTGPATTFTPLNLFNAALKKGAVALFNFDKDDNTGILVLDGELKINDSELVSMDHFAYFLHDGEDIKAEAISNSMALVLSGKPIPEPIASSGPFVMNTEEEINQAYRDYYSGKFGDLQD
jgi:redox-sensitive bicupin YhaK (pirin superfamily)